MQPPSRPTLRQAALAALLEADPTAKMAAVQRLWATRAENAIEPDAVLTEPPGLPGRPSQPLLVAPGAVPQRSAHDRTGRAALFHAIAHIEFNAINLALDAVWRFAGLPAAYYLEWLQVAHEEAQHHALLAAHLQGMGHAYGDFAAHDGLWAMAEATREDFVARMALVPRTLEARGLDATPLIQRKLRQAGDGAGVALLDIILRDEVGHVAIGNRWYRYACEQAGLDPLDHYDVLVERHAAPRLKPPFNEAARRAAGFTDAELARLAAR